MHRTAVPTIQPPASAWRQAALAGMLGIGLFAPCAAALAPATDGAPPPPEQALELDDAAEPFVPKNPRTEKDEDHIRALALFAAARVAEQKQDYELALRNYQRAYRFDPAALAALREIVPLAFNLDRQEEGVRYALILAERDPTDATMLRRLAIYLTENNDVARALRFYEKAASLLEASGEKPTAEAVMTWLEMGRLYFLTKEYVPAAGYFEKVAAALASPGDYQLSPAAQKALLNKGDLTYQLFGEAFLEADRPADAQAAFEKVQQIKADEGRRLYNLARVLARQRQPAQALARLEAYLAGKFSTQGTAPYELFEQLLETLGQETQLLERLESYRASDTDNLVLAYFLAERYRQAGQLDKAAPVYAELIAKNSARPPLDAIVSLVDVYRRQQDAARLLPLLGDLVARAGTLTPLGKGGDELAADKETAAAVVAAAERQRAEDEARLDYGQRLAAALLALKLAEYDVAESLFKAALEQDSTKATQALVSWGLELFMAGQYERAAGVFQRGLDEKLLPADNAAVYFYLAGALEMSGRTEEALERARQAADLDKNSARFASRLGWIQFHAKRHEAAKKSYLELLEKFDKKHDSSELREAMNDARLVLSNIAVFEGNLPEAEEWLEQALDEFPEDIGALNDLGYLWADAGKHLERARAMIQAAVDKDPKNMAYRDSLGWVLFRLGRYPEAVAELKVAAAGPDPDGVVLDHLGDALAKNGQADEAQRAWTRAAAAFDTDRDADKAAAVRQKLAAAAKEQPSAESPSPASPASP